MATPNLWIGNATAVYHTFTITIANTATGTGTVTITHGTKTVTFVYANLDTAAFIAAGIAAALQASTIPEFTEISWTYPGSGAVVTGQVIAQGVPAYITSGTTGGTATTATTTNTIAPSGPNFANVAANWSLGLPDGSTQEAVFADGPDCLYGLEALGWTNTPNAIMRASYAGAIGLPRYRNNGQGQTYLEFRRRDLPLPGSLNRIGDGDGQGSSRIIISLAAASELRILKTGQSDSYAVNIVPIAAATAWTKVTLGDGSLAIGYGEATGATGNTLGEIWTDEGSRLIVGRDLTVPLIAQQEGDVIALGTVTLQQQRGGTYRQDDGELGTINMRSGSAVLNHAQSSDIIPQLQGDDILEVPTLTLAGNLEKTLAGGYVRGGASIQDPNGITTIDAVEFDMQSLRASLIGDGFTVSAAPII